MQVWDEAGGCVRYAAEDGLRGRGGWKSRSPWPSSSSSPSASTSASPPLSMGSVAENEAIVKSLLASVRASPAPPTEFFGCGGLEALSLPKEAADSSSLPLARLSFASAASSSSSSPQTTLSARLVVGADGARSAVRALSGIRSSPWGRDYGAAAVVATVRLAAAEEQEDKNVAWQRFLSSGPLALLPLRGGFWSVVWSTTPEHARELSEAGERSPEAFAAAVDRALRRRGEGESEEEGGAEGAAFRRFPLPARVLPAPGAPSPRSFPLRRSSAGTFVLPRLALVGDAAHSVHPLGGQGVNLGFGDASCLAAFLAARAAAGADPGGGGAEALERGYGAPRRAATEAMGAALDALQRAFGPQRGPLAGARAAALRVIDGSGPVRAAIVRYAMGL